MERHTPNHTPSPQQANDQAHEAAIRSQRARERAVLGAWVGATLVALVSTVMLLESCGSHDRTGARQAEYTEPSSATAGRATASDTRHATTAAPPASGALSASVCGRTRSASA